MLIRGLTLRYNEVVQGFPEDALRSVTFGREVLNATEHFFVHGNVPHLTFVLSLGDSPKYENAGSYRPRDPNAPDPEDGMTDAQKARYRALKAWLNETAKAEGCPGYAIARNVQLAELAKAAHSGLRGAPPRYMDDLVFFTETNAEAWRLCDAAKKWLADERVLETKDEAMVVVSVTEGVPFPFLGLRIWPGCWRLKRERFLRTRRTFAERVRQLQSGAMFEARFARCAVSSDGASRWFGFKGILNDLAPEEGSSSGSNRVKRGGVLNNNASNCTSSNRNNNTSNENNNSFRLVSTMSEQTGFHSGPPVLRVCGDEHARNRSDSSVSDRRAGNFTKKGCSK